MRGERSSLQECSQNLITKKSPHVEEFEIYQTAEVQGVIVIVIIVAGQFTFLRCMLHVSVRNCYT